MTKAPTTGMVGKLKVGQTLSLDGVDWVISEIRDGRWVTVVLTNGDSTFITGGWWGQLVSRMGLIS